ncbi:MAG: DUF4491 family protein [Bacteroidales bacterium]|nr:DUF4491 family protein [Bacteroidales bacterium]
MSFNGIIVGAAVFLIIGICHPLVIKAEYHWGKQSWWIWLVAGLVFCAVSLFVSNDILPMLDDELYDMQRTDLHNEKYADFFDSFGFSVN